MSVITDTEQAWIDHAQAVADGSAILPAATIERAARTYGYDTPFRLQHAEKHLRNLFRVLLEALNSSSRDEIVQLFGRAYREHKK